VLFCVNIVQYSDRSVLFVGRSHSVSCRSVIFCDQSLISSNMSVGFFSGRSVGFVFRYSGFLQQSKNDLYNILEILMKLAYTTMHRLSVI
jgi:hypothetical protein